MKTIIFSLALALLAVSCSGSKQQQAQAADDCCATTPSADSTAIVNLINGTYRNALAALDTAAVTNAYTADGVVMGPGSPTAVGSEALATTYNAIFSAVKLDLNFHIDEMILGRQYAFVRSVSTGTATANGTSTREDNRELFVVKKENDDWKIARYIYNKQDSYKAAENTGLVNATADVNGTDADENAVRTLITSSYQTALNASNAADVAKAYEENAVVMGPGAPTVSGNANVEEMYKNLFSFLKPNLTFHIDEVVIDGEYGYVRSHSDGEETVNGKTSATQYREIFVVHKVNGEWKIAWYEYNQPAV